MDTDPNLKFYNSSRQNMSLSDVIEQIKNFIRKEPDQVYQIAIGTDSQRIGSKMVFVTGIYVHRKGKGAWCCISKTERKKITSLREKISAETAQTQYIFNLFSERGINEILDIILPYLDKNADVTFEAHIDVGSNGKTRKLIKEMVSYFSGMDVIVKIKPDSTAATSLANKHSKTGLSNAS